MGLHVFCRRRLKTFLVYPKKHIQLLSLTRRLSRISWFVCVCVCVCVYVCVCVECVSAPLLTSILVPNREHPEYEGAECGSKISPPVIPHRKVGRRDLNTEQHPWWWWWWREKERERERERRKDRGRGGIREEK